MNAKELLLKRIENIQDMAAQYSDEYVEHLANIAQNRYIATNSIDLNNAEKLFGFDWPDRNQGR